VNEEFFRFLDDGSFACYRDVLSFPGGRNFGMSPFRRVQDDNWYGIGHEENPHIFYGQLMADDHFRREHEVVGPYRVTKRGDFCVRAYPTRSGSEYALKFYTRDVIVKMRRSLKRTPWFDRIGQLADVANELLIMTRNTGSEALFRGHYSQGELSRSTIEASSEWPKEVEILLMGYNYQRGKREQLGEVSKASVDCIWNRAIIHAAHRTKNIAVDMNCVQQHRNATEAREEADVKFFAGITEEISSPYGPAEVEEMFRTFPDLLKWRFGGRIRDHLSDII